MINVQDVMSSQRTDSGLRQAIAALEGMLLLEPLTDQILSRCLDQLVMLTGASFGYVFRSGNRSDEERLTWELTSCVRLENGIIRRIPNSCTSDCVPADWQAAVSAGRCIVGDGSERGLPIPHYHPDIRNFLCVPLVDARKFYGAIFLCNAKDEFSQDIGNRLRPFVAAAGCLFRSAAARRPASGAPGAISHWQSHPSEWLDVLDSVFNAVLVVNDLNIIVLCNQAAVRMLNIQREEIVGSNLSRFIPKDTLRVENLATIQVDSAAASGHQVFRRVHVEGADGTHLLVDINLVQVVIASQNLKCLVLDDLSRHLQVVNDYYNTLHRFQVLTNLAPVGILQLDRHWECTYVNDTFCEYLEMTPDEALGKGWLSGIHDTDINDFTATLQKDILMGGGYEGEFRLVSPLGKVTWVKANARCLYTEMGDVSGMIMALSDITDRLQNERRLRDIAERDQLTGLINRGFFFDRLETALRGVGRYGQVSVMYLDLDDFKHINDTFGHDAGDQLLCEVSDRLLNTLRRVDSIARIGGDEFAVVMTNVQSLNSVNTVADKILEAFAAPIYLDTNPVYVTCSIGIAVADCPEMDARQLLKQADSALYRAKGAGRNQYMFYSAEMERVANIHVYLRRSLKEKQQKEFSIVFQPLVDAATGRIVSLEALSRWNPQQFNAVGPDVFVRMIEESGLITDFADWLYAEVFSNIGNWIRAGVLGDVTVAINLSARQFRNADLAERILSQCDRFGVSPSSVVLEVTETALIDDAELASSTLSTLRHMGFTIALDDFGTGYSSLVYLRRMPLDHVKIDRSFVEDVVADDEDARIVEAIIALAAKLGLKVVAEGVPDEQVSAWLLERDCPIQQGYHFYRPLKVETITDLLTAQVAPQTAIEISVRSQAS